MQAAADTAALRERARSQRETARQSVSARREGRVKARDSAWAHGARLDRVRSGVGGSPVVPALEGASDAALGQERAFACERLDALVTLVRRAESAGAPLDVAAGSEAFALLAALLACTSLGDGFTAIAGGAWIASRKAGGVFAPGHLPALRAALEAARREPDLAFDRACGLLDAMEDAGLATDLAALDGLAEDVGGDDEDEAR